jgi:hypothetical protein
MKPVLQLLYQGFLDLDRKIKISGLCPSLSLLSHPCKANALAFPKSLWEHDDEFL